MDGKEYRERYTKEKHIQRFLCEWLEYTRWKYFAVPNGQYRRGQRPEAGMQSGVPDLMIPEPTTDWAGLFIELKTPGNYPRKEQREWLQALKDRGYATVVCRSVDEGQHKIRAYMNEELHEEDQWPAIR